MRRSANKAINSAPNCKGLTEKSQSFKTNSAFFTPPKVFGWSKEHNFGGAGEERLLVFEEGLPPISILELLSGGFEEWSASEKPIQQERNKWLVRISRHWQRLRSERYR
jgi:hypothetical protein